MKRATIGLVLLLIVTGSFAEDLRGRRWESVEDLSGGWYFFEADEIGFVGFMGEEEGTMVCMAPIGQTYSTFITFGVPMGIYGELRAVNISSPVGPMTGDMGIVNGDILWFQGDLAVTMLTFPVAINIKYGKNAKVVYTAKDKQGITRSVTVSGITEQGMKAGMEMLKEYYAE